MTGLSETGDASDADASSGLRPARIAYVDDCDDEFFVTDLLLRRAKIDLDITRFVAGSAFLDWLRARDEGAGQAAPMPDLAVLDLNLPGMDGFEILRALAERPDWRGVVRGVCSGSVDPVDRQGALAVGAAFFLSKPFDAAAVEAVCAACPQFQLGTQDGRRRLMVAA